MEGVKRDEVHGAGAAQASKIPIITVGLGLDLIVCYRTTTQERRL